jgi:hypothetical protein
MHVEFLELPSIMLCKFIEDSNTSLDYDQCKRRCVPENWCQQFSLATSYFSAYAGLRYWKIEETRTLRSLETMMKKR